jgi:hypothetical protein
MSVSKRLCAICNSPVKRGHYYMVEDKIWFEAKLRKKQIACIDCLSEQLKRPLKGKDFTDCLLNEGNFMTKTGRYISPTFRVLVRRGIIADAPAFPIEKPTKRMRDFANFLEEEEGLRREGFFD